MLKPDSLVDSGLSASLLKLGRAIEERAAKNDDAPKRGEVVQFRIPFPEDKPWVCNVIARSSLFAAIKSKDRRHK